MAEVRGKPLSDLMLEFIGALRGAGVRVSVAESLDAMRAIGAAGLTRSRMREALRASLIKNEADSPVFDELFAGYFDAPRGISGVPRDSRDRSIGVTGKGSGQSQTTTPTASCDRPEPSPSSQSAEPHPDTSAEPGAAAAHPDGQARDDSSRDSAVAREGAEQAQTAGTSPARRDSASPRHAGIQDLDRVPFARYSALEYEEAREALAILQRRLRVRLGRRMRFARRGRLDFRRTIRAAIQRGGALLDLRFRTRRPRHIDLVVLADISGSVHYASTLMLELIAGAQRCFRRMRAFVFIDRLATADFEAGHLVMTPVLDLYARSDFGRVFAELRDQHADLLTRATVLVIMGDGRNNRRPARADILRDLARRSRTAIWLNPEPPERWGTGDSAIESYRKVVDRLLPSGNLRELEAALAQLN
jgi:uncharacterized protein with von Willebrand factor type A (vWA) domain